MDTRESPTTSEPDVARLYHLASSHERARPIEPTIDPHGQPMRFRTYPGSLRVRLPGRDFAIEMTLGQALEQRRSIRDLALSPMPIEALGRLLHASYGVRGHRRIDGEWSYDRPAPSAGGRYPLEIYVATRMVTSLADGIYHYDARAHELELVREGRAEPSFGDLAIGQEVLDHANLAIVITAVRDRTMWKYGQRGYRYVWIDAGHVGQNLYLVATALGLGPTAIGGFFDREVSALLSLPEDEEAIYLVAVGQPKPGALEEGK
jgi:SagB-type dehydrogenase family enzyme